MAWVTWRQHRVQVAWLAGMLILLAAAAVATELPILAAYHREPLASCLPPSNRSGCDILVAHFRSEFLTRVDAVRALVALPALAGVLVGAPLLAREVEHGTYRFAWTQTVTRRRWLATKTVLLGGALVLAAAAVSALTTWWRQPFDALGGRISPTAFDVEGLVVPAYTLFAFAVGVLAGLLLRRTLAAMSVTVLVFVACRLAVVKFARPHFLPPLHQTESGLVSAAHARDWVLSDPLVDVAGRTITTGREDLAVLHAQHAQIDPHAYLRALGWHRVLSFQPADRFWTFQLIEAGLFAALALLVLGATITLVRWRPA